MKYWAYLNNEVLGPFEKEQLKGLANFSLSSLICPEGGQADGWKEASTIPEVRAVFSPAPAPAAAPPPRREEPFGMTMRGTIIDMPPAASPAPASAAPKPAAAPPVQAQAEPPRKVEEPPLAMTMRGTLIEQPPASSPASVSPAPSAASAAFARAVEHAALEKPKESPARALPGKAPAAADDAPSRQELESQVAQLKQKIEQMSALLTSMGDSQFQLLNRLARLENAVVEIKAMLLPPAPKQ